MYFHICVVISQTAVLGQLFGANQIKMIILIYMWIIYGIYLPEKHLVDASSGLLHKNCFKYKKNYMTLPV